MQFQNEYNFTKHQSAAFLKGIEWQFNDVVAL